MNSLNKNVLALTIKEIAENAYCQKGLRIYFLIYRTPDYKRTFELGTCYTTNAGIIDDYFLDLRELTRDSDASEQLRMQLVDKAIVKENGTLDSLVREVKQYLEEEREKRYRMEVYEAREYLYECGEL